nr:immunoglobulin heavy chain junction region [Mus musculus]MBK4186697.1 immunoglobulin heavy chain junction region [Mus musculus]
CTASYYDYDGFAYW